MSSKRRLRRQQCGGKVQHPSAAAAQAAIHQLKQRSGSTAVMNVYRCAFCKQLHIGHAPMRVQRRLAWA